MNKNSGFTLIEILVVVAITAILAGVVLALLTSARDKGSDAVTKASLSDLRKETSLYFNDDALGNGSYNTTGANRTSTCTNTAAFNSSTALGPSTNAAKLLAQAVGNPPKLSRCSVNGAGTGWLAAVMSDATHYWCSDYLGTIKLNTLSTSLSSDIPTGTVVCP